MSGARSRSKGRRAEGIVALMLAERDYTVVDSTSGKAGPDFLATRGGIAWSFEVKDQKLLDPCRWREQARSQQLRGTRWALAYHLPGSSSWVVEMQGLAPRVWHQRSSGDSDLAVTDETDEYLVD